MKAADFGFVGQAYEAADPYQDSQRLINWYVEISQDDKSKTPTALLGTPGKQQVFDFTITSTGIAIAPTGGVRGVWVLPGGTRALWVVGRACILTDVTVPATQTSIAQFSVSFLGNLNTNAGPVCIRDNGFSSGTPTAVIVDGPYGYFINMNTLVFTQITDPGFLGADRVAFIDGWFIFNQPGTQKFYTTGPTPYALTFPGAFFNLKDSSSDNLITLMEQSRELWLIGERASEVWYDAGGANFAFTRIPGVAPQIGCSAKNSIARLGDSLVWLGRSERGENVVIKTEQYGYTHISSQAVSTAIATYPLVSDAIGFTYEEDSHLFYVLTFPTADKTWVYDVASEMWHQRASFDPATGVLHRDKANCFANYQNLRVVGDFQAQKGYRMTRQVFVDGDTPLIALRRCPHIWSREDRKRVFVADLQIEFKPGVGLQTGQGSNPQVMLSISYDGAATFNLQYLLAIGKAGKYKNRAIRRRLSAERDIVMEASISDPVARDIVGATLTGQLEESDDASTI